MTNSDYLPKALVRAYSQIGVKESPPNSNNGPEISEYFKTIDFPPGHPWSSVFVLWCFFYDANMKDKLSFIKSPYVPYVLNELREKKYIIDYPSVKPKVGDIVFYDWQGDGLPDHCGILYKLDKDLIYTIEGNVSISDEGGEVEKRVRQIKQAFAFARIN